MHKGRTNRTQWVIKNNKEKDMKLKLRGQFSGRRFRGLGVGSDEWMSPKYIEYMCEIIREQIKIFGK